MEGFYELLMSKNDDVEGEKKNMWIDIEKHKMMKRHAVQELLVLEHTTLSSMIIKIWRASIDDETTMIYLCKEIYEEV